jgi:8-oxo-dGTP pyrophosphatase MutT (NUDIX family)
MEKRCMVAGCFVIEKGKVLLLHHTKIGLWLPPGGHLEENEFPNEAAIRETKEETGLDVELLCNDAIMHTDTQSHTLEVPFTIIYEHVPYKTEPPHIHFDMSYVAKVRGGILNSNKESDDIGWFDSKELERLETLPSVRNIALEVLRQYGNKL